MSGTDRRVNDLPVGRRVAQWRVRRNMTQQQFADRLGKSKSWVDKVERGARRLERMSNLREVAEALRIDLAVLLADRPGQPDPVAAGVEGVRAALARYHVEAPAQPPDLTQLRARLDHAGQGYRHARYPALLAQLPGLLDAARTARATRPSRTTDALLAPTYGLTALVLVKVGQGELAWLAADRGLAAGQATGDARVAAAATVPLAQALRSVGRLPSAMEAAAVAAHRLMPAGTAATADPPLLGTLLLQAALAAAGRGLGRDVRRLLDQAAELARQVGIGDGGFGPAAVEAARVVTETTLGEVTLATARHERLVTGNGWRWLPAEHRAAYLLDVARAYVEVGDLPRAGRAVLDAERTARGEVHDRPAVRDLVAVLARSTAAPPDLARLAAALRVA